MEKVLTFQYKGVFTCASCSPRASAGQTSSQVCGHERRRDLKKLVGMPISASMGDLKIGLSSMFALTSMRAIIDI